MVVFDRTGFRGESLNLVHIWEVNEGIGLALDGTSNVYITGTTNSTNFRLITRYNLLSTVAETLL